MICRNGGAEREREDRALWEGDECVHALLVAYTQRADVLAQLPLAVNTHTHIDQPSEPLQFQLNIHSRATLIAHHLENSFEMCNESLSVKKKAIRNNNNNNRKKNE